MSVLQHVDVPMIHACAALGINRATFYRSRSVAIRPVRLAAKRRSPRKLRDEERAAILDVLHSQEFADQSPREVYGTLLSRGVCLASVSSMYRILATAGESRERRLQRPRQIWPAPSLVAIAPNQVWTWDISKLRGPAKGVFFYAFVVIDLFSRYVVGWMVERSENGTLAEQLLDDAHARYRISRGTLTIHSDRGSPMTCDTVSDLFKILGVTRSLSRPRVSNDNAFSESQFRTLKYHHDYPQRFASIEHARAWLQRFITWYNDRHCHVGLALFTPADVFFGRVATIAAQRQVALDACYAQNPERFVRGRPLVRLPPSEVRIDPDCLHHPHSIRCSEPPPEASVRPSPAPAPSAGAEGGSRAAQLPSEREGTLDAPEHRRSIMGVMGDV